MVTKRFDKQKRAILGSLPPDITYDLNSSDIGVTGAIIAILCACLSALSLAVIVPSILSRSHRRNMASIPFGNMISFLSIFLFCVEIPFVVFFIRNSVQLSGTKNGVALSGSDVQDLIESRDIHLTYKSFSGCK